MRSAASLRGKVSVTPEMRALNRHKGLPAKMSLRRWTALYLQERRRARMAASAGAGPSVPNAPSGLVASDNATFVHLQWVDNSSNETSFNIYRAFDGGALTLFQTVGANQTTYDDYAILYAHQYGYVVSAVNAQGESSMSNQAVVVIGS